MNGVIQKKKDSHSELPGLLFVFECPGGPLKYNVVSRHNQGVLKYTLNKYFLLEPKYTPNCIRPKRVMQQDKT